MSIQEQTQQNIDRNTPDAEPSASEAAETVVTISDYAVRLEKLVETLDEEIQLLGQKLSPALNSPKKENDDRPESDSVPNLPDALLVEELFSGCSRLAEHIATLRAYRERVAL